MALQDTVPRTGSETWAEDRLRSQRVANQVLGGMDAEGSQLVVLARGIDPGTSSFGKVEDVGLGRVVVGNKM